MKNSLPAFVRFALATVACLPVQGLRPTSAVAQGPVRAGPVFPVSAVAPSPAAIPSSAPATRLAPGPLVQPEDESPSGRIFVAALGTSVLGGFAGGATAVWLDDESLDVGTYILGVIVGATVGSSVGAALGADLADGEGGSFRKRLLVAMLVGGAGIGLAASVEDGRVLFAMPVLQSIAMVVMN